MEDYPHRYVVRADADRGTAVTVGSAGLPVLATDAPPQFGGPSGLWSPETLLVAAAAGCFVLTFRAVAAASKLDWVHCECDGEGVLDRSDGVVRFTELHLRARLVLPAGADPARARRILEKAERSCLITRSLALRTSLTEDVVIGEQPERLGA